MKKELKKFTEIYCKTCTAPCEKGITENDKEFICAETGHRMKKNKITGIIEEHKKNKEFKKAMKEAKKIIKKYEKK